jgi:hypothetical protein
VLLPSFLLTLLFSFIVVNAIFNGELSISSPNHHYHLLGGHKFFCGVNQTTVHQRYHSGDAYVRIFGHQGLLKDPDRFPKWKFFIMGSLDGLSLLFLLVGGAYVSGIKQLILLQGLASLSLYFLLSPLPSILFVFYFSDVIPFCKKITASVFFLLFGDFGLSYF